MRLLEKVSQVKVREGSFKMKVFGSWRRFRRLRLKASPCFRKKVSQVKVREGSFKIKACGSWRRFRRLGLKASPCFRIKV